MELHEKVITSCDELHSTVSLIQDEKQRLEFSFLLHTFQLDAFKSLKDNIRYSEYFEKFNSFFISNFEKFNADKDLERYIYSFYYFSYYYSKILNNYSKCYYFLDLAENEIKKNKNKPYMKFEHRMSQVLTAKGILYKEDNNLKFAQRSLEQAFHYALIADQKFNKELKKTWNYSLTPLLELLKVTNEDQYDMVLSQILSHLKKIETTKGFYKNENIRKVLMALMDIKDKKRSLVDFIKSKAKSIPIANTNVPLSIKLLSYYIDSLDIPKAEREWRHLLSIADATKDFIATIEIKLLEARLLILKKSFGEAGAALSFCHNVLNDNKYNEVWKTPVVRNQILIILKNLISLENVLYAHTKELKYLESGVHVAYEAIKGLNIFRSELVKNSDRIELMNNMDLLAQEALKSFTIYQSHGGSLDYDLVLAYIESKKSFNLRYKQSLLNSLTKENQIKLYELDFSIDRLEALVDQKFSESVQAQLDSLYQIKYEFLQKNDRFKINHSIASIQEKLNENQSIVDYFYSSEAIYLIIIHKSSVHFTHIDSSTYHGDKFLQTVSMANLAVTEQSQLGNKQNILEYKRMSHYIYTILYRPFESYFKEQVILIPDARWAAIPFAALLPDTIASNDIRKWNFWIKTKSIQYQPSVFYWSDQYNNSKQVSKYTYDVVAFAPRFSNLSHNQSEVISIADLFRKKKLYIDSTLSVHDFYEHVQNSKIIYFSGHAYSNSTDESASWIAFNTDSLRIKDLDFRQIKSDLIMLSACETGVGKIENAEGIMSLSRAFINSGAKSTISTLWRVNDATTRLIAIPIFRYLQQGYKKSEAIRQAQLDYLASAKTSDQCFPYYWAGYQFQGDESPIENDPNHNWFNLFSIFPILSFSIFGFKFLLGNIRELL